MPINLGSLNQIGAFVGGATQGLQQGGRLGLQIKRLKEQRDLQAKQEEEKAQQAEVKAQQDVIKNLESTMRILDKDDPRRGLLQSQIIQLRGVNIPVNAPPKIEQPTAAQLSRSRTLTGQNVRKEIARGAKDFAVGEFPEKDSGADTKRNTKRVNLINTLDKRLTDKQALLSTPGGQANAAKINQEIVTLTEQIANQRRILKESGAEDISNPALLESATPPPAQEPIGVLAPTGIDTVLNLDQLSPEEQGAQPPVKTTDQEAALSALSVELGFGADAAGLSNEQFTTLLETARTRGILQ